MWNDSVISGVNKTRKGVNSRVKKRPHCRVKVVHFSHRCMELKKGLGIRV